MPLDPGTNAHIQLGKAWGSLQVLTSTWAVNRVSNIAALATKIRRAR